MILTINAAPAGSGRTTWAIEQAVKEANKPEQEGTILFIVDDSNYQVISEKLREGIYGNVKLRNKFKVILLRDISNVPALSLTTRGLTVRSIVIDSYAVNDISKVVKIMNSVSGTLEPVNQEDITAYATIQTMKHSINTVQMLHRV